MPPTVAAAAGFRPKAGVRVAATCGSRAEGGDGGGGGQSAMCGGGRGGGMRRRATTGVAEKKRVRGGVRASVMEETSPAAGIGATAGAEETPGVSTPPPAPAVPTPPPPPNSRSVGARGRGGGAAGPESGGHCPLLA